MAEKLEILASSSREDQYKNLLPQLESLIEADEDLISSLANVTAGLKEAFGFLWVGFYLVKGDKLVLGPFQGRIACTRIAKGKGVCGTAWDQNKTIIVPDVDKFEGHIACDSTSRSEIVIPIRDTKGDVVAVLDVDSELICNFSEVDRTYLEKLSKLLTNKHFLA